MNDTEKQMILAVQTCLVNANTPEQRLALQRALWSVYVGVADDVSRVVLLIQQLEELGLTATGEFTSQTVLDALNATR